MAEPAADDQTQDLVATFQYTVQDVEQLERLLSKRVPNDRYAIGNWIGLAICATVALIGLYVVNDGRHLGFAAFTLVWLAIIGMGWVAPAVSWLVIGWMRRVSAADPRRVGWLQVEIGPRGVVSRSEVSEEFISWTGICRVYEDHGMIGFMTTEVSGVFVPFRAFASDLDASNFLRNAKKFYRDRHETVAASGVAGNNAPVGGLQ